MSPHGLQLNFDPNHLMATDGKTAITEDMRNRAVKLEDSTSLSSPNKVFIDPWTNIKWVE
jgi:hypothetical protein